MGAMSELHIQMQDQYINTIHRAENGDMELLEALIYLEEQRKQLENSLAIIKDFKDSNIEHISNEIEDYPDGYRGYKVEVRNGGRVYKFDKVEEWKTYKKNLKDCEDRLKQAFISKEKGMLVATEDGEEIQLPEISYRKSSVIVKKQ